MKSWRNKVVAIFAVVSFLLGFALCEVACASGDDHSGNSNNIQHHCVADCACHGATLPSTSATHAAPPADAGEFVFAPVSNHSRLVAASIFHPPRA
jgi:hypothetical protein